MSEFCKTSTTDDVLQGIDLSGRTVFVTGANSGLGRESARSLAAAGARLIMAGRDLALLEGAANAIREQSPEAALETIVCDLGDLARVRDCGAEARERFKRIDVLINNAGVMACPPARTKDGFERQFGTNHLGHFALTSELMPMLLAGARQGGGARIVNLSSRGHHIAAVDFDDPHFERRTYNEWVSYGQSKTANVLFTVGLEQRFAGAGVHAFAVHPGGIETNLGRHLDPDQARALTESVRASDPDFAYKTIAQGAATQVWAAIAEQLDGTGGVYCEDCHIAAVDDESRNSGVRSYAVDPANAERLWAMSEAMIGAALAA
jgi:NAD(P)-dependent dehydrogenase (short-subunit alcohol dehydrogenase family)